MSDGGAPSSLYRWAAIGLFFALPMILVGAGVVNVLDASDTRVETQQRERQLSLFRERAGMDATQASPALDFSRLYLAAATPSLAGAQLQERLSSLIAAAGGKVIETGIVEAPQNDGTPGDASRVEARATFDIDNDGLLRVLYDLEAGLPIIEVGGLAVRPVGTASQDGGASPQTLRVDLTIAGHMREPVS